MPDLISNSQAYMIGSLHELSPLKLALWDDEVVCIGETFGCGVYKFINTRITGLVRITSYRSRTALTFPSLA